MTKIMHYGYVIAMFIIAGTDAGEWLELDTKFYYFSSSDEKMTFSDAETYCNNITANLTSIKTPEEHSLLVEHMQRSNYWIGLWLHANQSGCSDCSSLIPDQPITSVALNACVECRKLWRWRDGARMLNINGMLKVDRWLLDEPTGGQTCARLSTENGEDGYWKDVQCSNLYSFICKKENPCFTQRELCNGGQCYIADKRDDTVGCNCPSNRQGLYCETIRPTDGANATTSNENSVEKSTTTEKGKLDFSVLLPVLVTSVCVVALIGAFVTTCCFYAQRARRKQFESERAKAQLEAISRQTSTLNLSSNGTLRSSNHDLSSTTSLHYPIQTEDTSPPIYAVPSEWTNGVAIQQKGEEPLPGSEYMEVRDDVTMDTDYCVPVQTTPTLRGASKTHVVMGNDSATLPMKISSPVIIANGNIPAKSETCTLPLKRHIPRTVKDDNDKLAFTSFGKASCKYKTSLAEPNDSPGSVRILDIRHAIETMNKTAIAVTHFTQDSEQFVDQDNTDNAALEKAMLSRENPYTTVLHPYNEEKVNENIDTINVQIRKETSLDTNKDAPTDSKTTSVSLQSVPSTKNSYIPVLPLEDCVVKSFEIHKTKDIENPDKTHGSTEMYINVNGTSTLYTNETDTIPLYTNDNTAVPKPYEADILYSNDGAVDIHKDNHKMLYINSDTKQHTNDACYANDAYYANNEGPQCNFHLPADSGIDSVLSTQPHKSDDFYSNAPFPEGINNEALDLDASVESLETVFDAFDNITKDDEQDDTVACDKHIILMADSDHHIDVDSMDSFDISGSGHSMVNMNEGRPRNKAMVYEAAESYC